MNNVLKIQLLKIVVNKNSISYICSSNNKRFFKSNILTFKYDEKIDISDVPKSILTCSFIMMFMSISIHFPIEIYVHEIDKHFYDSIQKMILGLNKLNSSWNPSFNVICNNIISNVNINQQQYYSAVFFSGGIDSYFTVMKTYDQKPLLFNIIGSDYDINDYKNGIMENILNKASDNLNLNIIKCISNFKDIIKRYEWLYADYGLQIISHIIPIAWKYNIKTIWYSSGYQVINSYNSQKTSQYLNRPTASFFMLINTIEWTGSSVHIIGEEYNRLEKTKYIIDRFNDIGKYFEFHVCWEDRSGKNCCKCEKCNRTIYHLIKLGLNPIQYGFSHVDMSLIQKFKNDNWNL